MPAKISLAGQTFGRLKSISDALVANNRTRSVCKCECGRIVTVSNSHLRSGHIKSCGCFMLDQVKRANTRHGHFVNGVPSRTAMAWDSMIKRCYAPYMRNYKNYGGRGISVCKRWLRFPLFLEDMGEKPKGMSLERIDNNGNYEPGNCKWATPKEQARNRRTNRILTVLGVTGCVSSLCDHFGISHSRTKKRLSQGWPVNVAFFHPKGQHHVKRRSV